MSITDSFVTLNKLRIEGNFLPQFNKENVSET